MAKAIEMQYGMLSQVVSGNIYYTGCRCPMERGTFRGVWL